MNHKWVKDTDFVPGGVLNEKSICKICNCVRYKEVYCVKGIVSTEYSYTRSGVNFSYRPDCLNWNDNSIDISEEIMDFY